MLLKKRLPEGKHWTLKKELKFQVEELRHSSVEDDTYKGTLDSVEQIYKIRQTKVESRVKVVKDIVTAGVLVFVAATAYAIDKSDSIPRNKASAGVFGKIFHL